MTEKTERQLEVEAERAEKQRIDAKIAAALARHGIFTEPRPGFAARRRDRMLRVQRTRDGG